MRHLSIAILSATLLGGIAMAENVSTTLDDRTDVAVTAYNSGLALVRDVRKLTLPTGQLNLRFGDVAENIKPETVSLQSLSQAGSIAIYEQNYEYDLISPQKLMEKFVGREVTLMGLHDSEPFGERQGTLLSTNGGPVFQIGGEIYLGHPGTVVLPEVPDNLIAKPSLIWRLENTQAEQEIVATYLTNGLSWRADYVLTLGDDETTFDLAGWVTMNNQSGATYDDAKLKLVAGDVNLAQPDAMLEMAPAPMAARAMSAEDMQAKEEAFAEYHLYTIPFRTTIKQNQSKQVSLLQASGATLRKVYELRGRNYYYFNVLDEQLGLNPEAVLVFDNEEENQLGMPLPAGTMRIYQPDSEGMLQFAGEDRIEHTATKEEVRLTMGDAFDIVADRRQTDFKKISANVFETAFEIEIRNRKKSPVTVDVIEPMVANWRVVESSHEHTKRAAFTLQFAIDVAADSTETLTYRVRISR